MGGAAQHAGTGARASSARRYTILVTGGSHLNNPFLYSHVPYDPIKDFDAVTLAVDSAVVLTVHPSVPAQSVKDLVALIRSTPGKYSYASPGVGTPPQLVGALFRLSLDLDLVHVPFSGGGPAIASTVAGHTPISFGALAPAVPLVRDGKLRALVVTSKARTAALPEVPTMAEAGYPDVEGRAGPPWSCRRNAEGDRHVAASHDRRHRRAADIKERLGALGYEAIGSTPDQCAEFFKTEMAKWSKVIRASGIKAD